MADTQSLTIGDSDDSRSFEDRINRARENLRKQAEQSRAERANAQPGNMENDDCSKFKKSLDSSKIPWESNFMFEMNALQQGSVVVGPMSAEESVFLEETDAMADQLKYQDNHEHMHHKKEHGEHQQQNDQHNNQQHTKMRNTRSNIKEAIPNTGVVAESLPLREYQKSMTTLLNPGLGKTEEIRPEDVHGGMLKSKSHGTMKPASTTVAANTFSSWANLLDAANCKGKRRRAHKGFKLRQTYKENVEAERKRKELIENRRLDRQHEVWSSGLHKPDIVLGAYTQTTRPRTKTTKRRPHSAGVGRRRKSPSKATTSSPERRANNEIVRGDHDRMQLFASPQKGRQFELETAEDVQEFNDIKVDILKSRGLHSVAVKHSTKVLCGGEFTHVVMAHENDDEYIDPQTIRHGRARSYGSDKYAGERDDTSAFTSAQLLDTGSSSVFFHQPYSSSNNNAPSSAVSHSDALAFENPAVTSTDKKVTPELQGAQQFVSDLLKNSPMSPQNINYSSMQNTVISNAVKKMIEDFSNKKNMETSHDI
jgi:hypothetical protein